MKSVDDQYKEWLADQTFDNPPDKDLVKETLIKELEFLSGMDAKTYILYRKWVEIQEKYPARSGVEVTNFFFGESQEQYPELRKYKANIWIPDDPQDYLKLEPILIKHTEDNVNQWNELRVFMSSMINNSNIGRQMFYTVVDNKTGKYLGLICASGDFMDLTPRDTYIGWTREQRTKGMLNHTCIGSTIVPSQPLGYSYVGGKLIALLTISDVVERDWNESYEDKLVGFTTTSLFSSYSQYQNLSYWTKRGHSAGSIKFEPSREAVKLVREWLKYNHTRRYFEWYYGKQVTSKGTEMTLKRDHKQRSLAFAYAKLKIPKELYEANHARGIYFCPLFTNTNEYLRQEIDESKLVRRFDNSVPALVAIWKTKYAAKRLRSLLDDGRYNKETLFYDNLVNVSWEKAQEMYMEDVGR